MEAKHIPTILLLLPFFFACYANAQEGVLDITKFGAKPGGDITDALLAAWKEAVKSPKGSKIVIPKGEWTLLQVLLEGPNVGPIEISNQGTVKANPDPGALPKKDGQWITINYVNMLTLNGGGVFDGMGGEKAWKMNDCHKNKDCPKLPYNLSFNSINNSLIQDVTTKDSKNFHVNCMSSKNVTFNHFTISAPGDSPNTDGIHLARSDLVNITNSKIATGDDCISMGDELTNVHISNITCGPGHGISIGSLGKNPEEKDISGIHITNCKFIETQNGVRIKTWPAAPGKLKISDLLFEDLTMENAGNPVIIDQQYCPYNQCDKTKPSLIQISGVKVKNVKGSSSTASAVTLSCSSAKPCEDVEIGDVELTYTGKEPTFNTTCENVKPTLTGKQVPPMCAAGGAAKEGSAAKEGAAKEGADSKEGAAKEGGDAKEGAAKKGGDAKEGAAKEGGDAKEGAKAAA